MYLFLFILTSRKCGHLHKALSFKWIVWILNLWPRSGPPLGRTWDSVTGPPALWLLTAAVLAVDGAVGSVMEELHAANGPDLKAQAATGFGTVLPFVWDPSRQIKVRRLLRTYIRLSWLCHNKKGHIYDEQCEKGILGIRPPPKGHRGVLSWKGETKLCYAVFLKKKI